MKGAGSKNAWAFISAYSGRSSSWWLYRDAGKRGAGLSWLSYGQSFGIDEPIVLDLGVLVITFGLSIKITMASIIGVILSIIIYRFL